MISVWNKLSEEGYRAGFRRMLKRVYELPDGRIDNYDIKLEQNSACIVPMTVEGTIILTKQFRPGPEKVLLELPGGSININEAPEAAARRELLEETGYEGELRFIGTSLVDAYSTGTRYNFIATECKKVADPLNLENEFIEVEKMSLEDFRQHLRSGELTDVTTGYLGLDFLKLL